MKILSLAILCEENDCVMIGKHAAGPFAGTWGIASARADTDDRPTRAAARLAEYSSFGILGTRRSLEKQCEKRGRAADGTFIYSVYAPSTLTKQVDGVSSYITSCFPLDESKRPVCPEGLVPWTEVIWLELNKCGEKKLDPFSLESLRTLHGIIKQNRSSKKSECEDFNL